jgi:hypothetical protein
MKCRFIEIKIRAVPKILAHSNFAWLPSHGKRDMGILNISQALVARTTLLFSNFLFTNLFSIKFLYFFIISSKFLYYMSPKNISSIYLESAILTVSTKTLCFRCKTGYILRSLHKKYLRCSKHKLSDYSENHNFVKKYDRWYKIQDRGGLQKPCYTFFLLVENWSWLFASQLQPS